VQHYSLSACVATFLRLLENEDEGIMIPYNNGEYPTKDTMEHPRRIESSEMLLRKPQISHTVLTIFIP